MTIGGLISRLPRQNAVNVRGIIPTRDSNVPVKEQYTSKTVYRSLGFYRGLLLRSVFETLHNESGGLTGSRLLIAEAHQRMHSYVLHTDPPTLNDTVQSTGGVCRLQCEGDRGF